MSVLKGEGKVPILFGMKSVTAGAITHQAYLARPDLAGEWPTLLVVPSAWGVTSSMKDLARRLARRGVACVVVDLYRGDPPARRAEPETAEAALGAIAEGRARRDLDDVVRYVTNRAGFWSSAESGLGIMGIGAGGTHALGAALATDAVLVLASSLPSVELLENVTAPMLGIAGKDDDTVAIDDVMAARAVVPHAEWVLYDGVGNDFLDDYRSGFDLEAMQDAVERIAEFCEKHLPSRI
jgi:dienelactone hydrolase